MHLTKECFEACYSDAIRKAGWYIATEDPQGVTIGSYHPIDHTWFELKISWGEDLLAVIGLYASDTPERQAACMRLARAIMEAADNMGIEFTASDIPEVFAGLYV